MPHFTIQFKHTIEETHTAKVEAESEEKALEIFDGDPFQFIEGDGTPDDTQGVDIEVVEVTKE